ncbi:MAG TPA: IS4 family transposase [Caulobacter sp.]|nr:IS4 family transposase [Caulobacter sp.]
MLGRLLSVGARAVRVRRLGGDRAGEIRLTRFLRNAAVTPQDIAVQAGQRTSQRCQGRDVLVIQDTTVIGSKGGGGDYLHAAIALDLKDNAILGLVSGQMLERDGGRRGLRRERPIEEKESFRWLQGADEAACVCAGARRITVVADREGDIYEAFALRPDGVELLVRAAQDRGLEDGGKLFETLDALPEAGRAEVDFPAQPGLGARTVQLAVRLATLALAKPRRGFSKDLPATIAVQVVDVRQVAPKPGQPAVHWRLLTTHPVADAAQAWAMVELYRKRWAIEQLFRTLKTKGFDIEGLRIQDAAPRDNLVMATLIAAVTIQQMVHARDGGPGPLRPYTDAFEPEDIPLLEAFCAKLEGKTERQKNPHPKGSLAYAAWVCARLGGWTGYYGKPGPIVILEGWLEIQAAKRTLKLLGSQPNV